ncbi:MAG: hypothetical protein JWQ89_4492, partial [Devosia sp.]|nr:hypothetical protein [Devosia sp.]
PGTQLPTVTLIPLSEGVKPHAIALYTYDTLPSQLGGIQ